MDSGSPPTNVPRGRLPRTGAGSNAGRVCGVALYLFRVMSQQRQMRLDDKR